MSIFKLWLFTQGSIESIDHYWDSSRILDESFTYNEDISFQDTDDGVQLFNLLFCAPIKAQAVAILNVRACQHYTQSLESIACISQEIITNHRYPVNAKTDIIVVTDVKVQSHYKLVGHITAYPDLKIGLKNHYNIHLLSMASALCDARVFSSDEDSVYILAQNTGNTHSVSYIGGFDLYTLWDDDLHVLIYQGDYQPTPYFQQLVNKLHAAVPELWDKFVWDQSSWDVGGIAYLPNRADADTSKWRQLDEPLTPFIFQEQNKIKELSVNGVIADFNSLDIYGLAYILPEELPV